MKEATGLKKFKEWLEDKKVEVDQILNPPVIDNHLLPQKFYVLNNQEIAEIKFATNQDVQGIVNIQRECYDGEVPWGRYAVSNEIHKPTSFFLMAHHLELPIAFIGLSIRRDSLHITNIATLPSYQKHGLATFLIDMAAEIGQNVDLKTMTLEVRVSNESAMRLYRKIGFVDGRIKYNYYHNNGEDALEMARPLRIEDE